MFVTGLRTGEQRDDFPVAEKRVRPSMQQQQGRGVRAASSFVHVMQVRCIEVRDMVLQSIELALLRAPVVRVPPVEEQFVEIVRVAAAMPAAIAQYSRSARSLQALT